MVESSQLLLFLLILTGVESGEYLGCYRDPSVQARLLPELKTNFPGSLTVHLCQDHCRDKAFRYAGLEYRNECFCSNDRPSYKNLVDEEECNLKCDGDKTQSCGGNLRINVYDTSEEGQDGVRRHKVGCFRPSSQAVLLGPRKEMSSMSPELCAGYCYRRGYRLAALRNGNECSCGDSLKQAVRADDKECSSPCAKAQTLKCGGKQTVSVYHTGIPDNVPSDDHYLGCYIDQGSPRLVSASKVVLNQTNTPRRCVNLCLASNFRFAGVEYGYECFCGNKKPPAEKETEEHQCQTLCPGNRSEFCGGTWRILVYATGLGTVTPYFPEMTRQPSRPTTRPGGGQTTRTTTRPTRPTTTTTTTTTTTEAPGVEESLVVGGEEEVTEAQTPEPAPSCPLSATTVNGKPVCKGQLVFEDRFSGSSINPQKWTHHVLMPWTPDYEFVKLDESPTNSFVRDGKLFIKPTLRDAEVRAGKIELQNCTGQQFGEECFREAKTFSILPPVDSARIHTKDVFTFRYGIVNIRAKLPLGDWIIPELWLEPRRREYGLAYSSGRVRLAMVRGNRELLSGDAQLGNSHLESGILMGVGLDSGVRGRTVVTDDPAGWHNDFHNFTFVWTPDNLSYKVDGGPAQSLMEKDTQVLCDLVMFSDEECSIWKKGSNIAPFDKEFYLSFGVTVGGMRDFPDESISGNNVKKPWKNMSVKAMANFWKDRENWISTWDGDNSALQVDSVRVHSL